MINDEHVICNNPHCQKSSLLWTLERVSFPLFMLYFNFMSRRLPCRSRDGIGGIQTGPRAGRLGGSKPGSDLSSKNSPDRFWEWSIPLISMYCRGLEWVEPYLYSLICLLGVDRKTSYGTRTHLQRKGNQSTVQFNLYVSFTYFANATGAVF